MNLMLDRIPYTDTFFSELNPHSIRCIALLRGHAVPDSRIFTYCELGCGTGHSLLVYAAANPEAKFIGVDFNQQHILYAEQRAETLGITNCTFIHADITTWHNPTQCDYIVMHGVYAWVHQEVRNAIHRIIEQALSPNGLVLVSYNAYPGWHVYEPLRMMMREYSLELSEDPFYNAEQGIGFLRWMHERQSPYMKLVPMVESFIEELEKHDPRYIIHEYYADHWTPLLFSQMNQYMQGSGMSFGGQIPFFLNDGNICLPEGFEEFSELKNDETRFEAFKDLIRNTMFRWDVYASNRSTQTDPFDAMDFGNVQQDSDPFALIELPGCTPFKLNSEFHSTILNAISDGNTSVSSLCSALDSGPEQVKDAVYTLLMAEQIKPIPHTMESQKGNVDFRSILLRFLEEALLSSEHVIPSLFSGSGIHINQDIALMLIATLKHSDDPIGWIAEWMEVHGYGDYVDCHQKAEHAYHSFTKSLPFWKYMRIL